MMTEVAVTWKGPQQVDYVMVQWCLGYLSDSKFWDYPSQIELAWKYLTFHYTANTLIEQSTIICDCSPYPLVAFQSDTINMPNNLLCSHTSNHL